MKRITVKIDEEFHREVKLQATRDDKTISEVVKALLKAWLDERKKA